MYIGPWQEYNLSKASTQNRASVTNKLPLNASSLQALNFNNSLKEGIENAIIKSVDPSVAEKAIQAVENFFANQQQPISTKALVDILNLNNNPRHDFLNATVNNHRRPRPSNTRRSFKSSSNDFSLQNTRFPEISSAHSRRSSQSSPLSVRSSQSEPTANATRLPRLKLNQQQMQQRAVTNNYVDKNKKQLNNTTQSKAIQEARIIQQQQEQVNELKKESSNGGDYNPRAVVNFLRHERRNKERETLEKLTGWNTSKIKSLSNADHNEKALSVSNSSKTTSMEEERERKIEKVNAMRNLYLQNLKPTNDSKEQQQDTASKIPDNISYHQPRPPIEKSDSIPSNSETGLFSPPKTPTIADLDITESELLLISKYFIQQSTDTNTTNSQINKLSGRSNIAFDDEIILEGDEEESMEITSSKSKPPTTNNSDHHHLTDSYQVEKNENETSKVTHDDNLEQIGKIDFSQVKTSDTSVDELYVGGIDGLLKWSKQLDFDMSF